MEWKDKTEADIAIYLIAADSIGDFNVADVVYTSTAEENIHCVVLMMKNAFSSLYS